MDIAKINETYRKVSYYKQHNDLTLQEWQYALRMKFAEKVTFGIEKLEGHPVFSDYLVHSAETRNTYKVSIRDNSNSMNFCSCYDFKTNHLGTCKHIEAVILFIKKKKQNIKILEKEFVPHYSSIYVDYRGGRFIRMRIGTENRMEYLNLREKYFDKNNQLTSDGKRDFYQLYEEGVKINPDFRCYPDVISEIVEHQDAIHRKKIVDGIYRNNGGNIGKLIQNATLYNYQKEGILFAASAGRSLIADDMGLGKTIQAIATAELMKKEFGIQKVLIICPTSLKYQWQAEIQKFSTSTVNVIEGGPHKRPEQYKSDHFYNITSYQTASNDVDVIKSNIPDLIILDEAQRIKNFRTKTALNIKKLPSDYTIVLTGTPLENKLEELYSIVQFIDPFLLGPYHEFMNNHQLRDDNGKIKGYRDLNMIGQKLSGLMVRRKKKEVLSQLPERMDKNLLLPMTEEQMDIHDEYKAVVGKLVMKWRRLGFLPEKDKQRLLISLNMMRMVCDSTYILDQKTRHDTKIDELMNILEEVVVENGEKVVVFSQWERMTRLVAEELEKREIGYRYLHGGIPSEKRGDLITDFTNDNQIKVFLSTDAGGTGLNLQAASTIINLDIPWNPAVLEQRVGRIHRIGQKNNISVINLVAAYTIEHRMLDVISFKASLADGILDAGDDVIYMGESRFKKFMSSVDEMLGGEDETTAGTAVVSQEEEMELPQTEKAVDLFSDINEEPSETEVFEDAETGAEKQLAADFIQEEENIISQGIKLLGRFAQTLSDKEATKKLVSSVMEKDEKSGKTFLKIPVENQELVENAVQMIGNFLSSIMKPK